MLPNRLDDPKGADPLSWKWLSSLSLLKCSNLHHYLEKDYPLFALSLSETECNTTRNIPEPPSWPKKFDELTMLPNKAMTTFVLLNTKYIRNISCETQNTIAKQTHARIQETNENPERMFKCLWREKSTYGKDGFLRR